MIRAIAGTDLEKAVKLLAQLHARSPYRRMKPHWPTVVQTIVRLSSTPTGKVLVAEHDDELTGILIGVAQEYWWAEPKFGPRIASDLIFFSKHAGDGDEMMRQFKDWAFAVPRVVRVECGVASGIRPEKVTSFFEGLGFGFTGPMFAVDHPKFSEEEQSCPA